MGWAKLTDKRAMNPKLRRAGFEARGLDEAAICQIASDETDGIISEDTVEMLAIAHRCKNWGRLVDILVKERRWEPTDGGWIVKGYLKHNPTHEKRQADREQRRDAGQRGGFRSGEVRRSKTEAETKRTASPSLQPDASPSLQAEAKRENRERLNSRPVPVSIPISTNNKRGSETVADEDEPDKLVVFWLTACLGQPVGRFKLKDLLEARSALQHLRRFLDERVIEEQIGYLASRHTKPRTANYLLKACQSWGANNGVIVPPLVLATRQPPPDIESESA